MGETVKTKKQKKSWFKGLKAEFKKLSGLTRSHLQRKLLRL
jgi:hypothetical protein